MWNYLTGAFIHFHFDLWFNLTYSVDYFWNINSKKKLSGSLIFTQVSFQKVSVYMSVSNILCPAVKSQNSSKHFSKHSSWMTKIMMDLGSVRVFPGTFRMSNVLIPSSACLTAVWWTWLGDNIILNMQIQGAPNWWSNEKRLSVRGKSPDSFTLSI